MSGKIIKKILIGGRELNLEIGDLATQANATVLARYGETVVLATVVSTKPRDDLDYFPLQVEYIERLYAGGKIKGSRWVKREGRPSEKAVLTARLVDRSIRPLFPAEFKNETQVILTVLSVDHENDPIVLAGIAASTALHISDVPWQGPVSFIRVGFCDGKYVINPTNGESEASELDLIVSYGKDGVVMLEGKAKQLPEDKFFGAIEFVQDESERIVNFIEELRREIGKPKLSFSLFNPKAVKKVKDLAKDKIKQLVSQLGEAEVFKELDAIIEEIKEATEGIGVNLIKEAVAKLFKEQFRKKILENKRMDGRKLDQVRPLRIEVGVLPRTHGSAIFQRGETQVLTVTTLGPLSLKQLIESPEGEESKKYMHHYFMPPYSVGQTGRIGSPRRREIGHGALAEKALLFVVPLEEKFPYAIRLVSEILSSNGSTSMAGVCGSTLSLMDAGVPIVNPVAGISVGLVKEKEKFVFLTDIAGLEDVNGDMDFKLAGTKKGITVVQVDIKLSGLPLSLVKEAISRARKARLEILEEMLKVIAKPRAKVSPHAPKVVMLQIPVESIGSLIGPGGKTIKGLIEETGCLIDVEDDGKVSITGSTEESAAKASEKIDGLTREVEAGEEFVGTVKRVESFGAFVEFLPGREGMIHVSKIGTGFIKDVTEVLKVGQEVKVKLDEVDERGRNNLSLIEPKIQGTAQPSRPPRPQRFFPDRNKRSRFPSY